MRRTILLLSFAFVACDDRREVRPDDPDARVGTPDGTPTAPDADPGAPDAAPAAPDAEIANVVPEVTATTPTVDARGVEPAVEITATFSTDLDPSTVNATTFAVTRDGAPVAGSVRYADRVATFDPAAPLALDRTYTATVSASVTSNGGAPLAVPVAWSFTVRSGAWSAATPIDHVGDGSGEVPQVAGDDLGNVTAAWVESAEIYAVRFDPSGRWGAAAQLTNEDGRPDYLAVAAAPGGDALVAWSQERGQHRDIVASQFDAGVWGVASTLDPDPSGEAVEPKVAFSRDGDAMAVWTHWTGDGWEYWASHLETAWGAPVRLADPIGEDYARNEPYLGADDRGNYVTTFSRGSNPAAWFNEYTAGAGWGTSIEIPLPRGLWVHVYEVSLDASGTVWTGWSDHPSGLDSTVEVLRRVDGTWSDTRLDRAPDDTLAWNIEIAVAPSGEAVATWIQSKDDGPALWASRFIGGSAWSEPVRLTSPGKEVWSGSDVVIGDDGHAFAVWTEETSGISFDPKVFAAHQPAGGAWSASVQLSSGDDGHRPVLTVDATGAATAVWSQAPMPDSAATIWAARFE